MLLIFQLDYSALMGYTGAVFEKFFGTLAGSFVIAGAYLVWIAGPVMLLPSPVEPKGQFSDLLFEVQSATKGTA